MMMTLSPVGPVRHTGIVASFFWKGGPLLTSNPTGTENICNFSIFDLFVLLVWRELPAL